MKLIVWEIWSYLQLPVIWYLFRRFAKKNVFGDMVAGAMIGAFIEFSTEPLWTYHFRLTIYKDVPLSVVLGWGVMFTLVVFVSEKLYCWILKKTAIDPYDKKIFLFDVLGAALVGLPLETVGLKSGVWDYNYDVLQWNWGTIPFFNMPYEALMGYCLLMLLGPTFVRYWQGAFEGRHTRTDLP
ncbi:MAG TPA: hypothetical protein P5079_04320 [Elusimicrobiota bacterium]|nr:hypothetical protein [Elusimicrobiota bacterium]